MTVRLKQRLFLIAAIALLSHDGNSTYAQTAPVDSIVTAVRQRLAVCDSQFTEFTFVGMLTERELRDDGTVKSTKVSKTRHFVRGTDTHEVLEAMWEDGEEIPPSKLDDEREKRDKERAKQRKRVADGKEDESSRSATILEPFRDSHQDKYSFPETVTDTIDGVACWKITVDPVRADEKLVKGHAWVEQGSLRPVREEYDMAERPGPVKDFGIVMVHEPVADNCAFPSLFQLHVRGKALVFIKFNVDVELRMDSLQLNPGLPDSLFANPVDWRR